MYKVLLFLKLPPPYTGATIMNQLIFNSSLLNKKFEVLRIGTNYINRIEDMGNITSKKAFLFIKNAFRILKILLLYRPKIVYIQFSPSNLAFLRDSFYILLFKLFRRRILLHMQAKGLYKSANKNIVFHNYYRFILKNTYIICLSESLKKDLIGIFKGHTYVIPNCSVLNDPESDIKIKKLKFIDILFLSNLEETKGLIDLIEAVRKVKSDKPFRLIIVGKPTSSVSIQDLENLIAKNYLQGKVIYLGAKYDEEKITVLNQSAVFVLPTYYSFEALPVSIIEAMQFSLPIISTYEGGIPDIIDEGMNGFLIKQRDVDALSKRIQFLIENDELRREMGKFARKKYLENYTSEIFQNNIYKTISLLLNE